jgi:hypothetical protein
MTRPNFARLCCILTASVLLLWLGGALAQTPPAAATAAAQLPQRDGQHDFDFLFGRWKTHLKRLVHPLTGSHTWVEYDGTIDSKRIWGGRANYDEFEVDSKDLHIEGLTVRFYNPQSHQWSLFWANSHDVNLGQPSQPMVGEWKNGRGEFYDQEFIQGRAVFVRYEWTDITPTTAHFEQSFSADGGKTWEVNWISTMVRDGAPGAS